MYIVVEGPIGAGKTSLTNLISDHISCRSVFEIVAENPFLEKFYLNQEKWAFQLEMYFLAHRYEQLKSIKKKYLANNETIVADYDVYKNLIFAKVNLKGEDLERFTRVFDVLVTNFCEPDLYVFIKAPLHILKERISRRGRDFEQGINDEYLIYLVNAYDQYIETLMKMNQNVIVINGEKYDFVNNLNDRDQVKEIIDGGIQKTQQGKDIFEDTQEFNRSK